MQEHPTLNTDEEPNWPAGARFPLVAILAVLGIVLLVAARAMSESTSGPANAESRFAASYLIGYMFFLSISLGALFFVVLQHLTRAGWSVAVRRLAEILAANLAWWWLMFLPILIPVVFGTSPLYRWSDPAAVAGDELLRHKSAYLNGPFFAARAVFYFLAWGAAAWWLLRTSVRQDVSGDPALTRRMERAAPAAMILFALTTTFAAFDWLMAIEPHWFSSIFGVYFFAGSVVGGLSAMILFAWSVSSRGTVPFSPKQKSGQYPSGSFTVEHFHDLGKLLLGFVVFWGYMAFSQYLLIWYANIPEESVWYLARQTGDWRWVSVALLVAHLLIPFLGLLSRDVKRCTMLLSFWAIWLLAAHWLDLYWLVMPSALPGRVPFGILEIGCTAGLGCLFAAGVARTACRTRLVPVGDPRLGESLAFENP